MKQCMSRRADVESSKNGLGTPDIERNVEADLSDVNHQRVYRLVTKLSRCRFVYGVRV